MNQRICVIGGQIKSRIEEVPALLQSCLNDSWSADTFAKKVQSEITDKIVVKPGFPEQAFKLSASSFVAHSRASLKIQDGCNSNCSYCAIHMARGHSVSLDVQTAIDRVKELEALRHSEVVLTTVNIGQYKGVWKDGYCNFTGFWKIQAQFLLEFPVFIQKLLMMNSVKLLQIKELDLIFIFQYRVALMLY